MSNGPGQTTTDTLALPVLGLFAEVIGQPAVVELLRTAVRHPLHAYLFCGPPGSGTASAARAFAAALVCPNGGCGACPSCEQALAGRHPDVVVVERTGAALEVDGAKELVRLAQRRPFSSARQVLVVPDVHLAARAAPALLKTLEEPPPTTVFVLLADDVPPDLATVASRCVEVTFPPVPTNAIAEWLAGRGVEPQRAALVAEGADGDVDRARLLVEDDGYVARLALWRSVPTRLDGRGTTAAGLAKELREGIDAAVIPLRARHAAELEQASEEADAAGERSAAALRALTERHHREERRWRTTELRAGLATLARVYRDRLSDAVFGTGTDGPLAGDDERTSRDAICLTVDAARALRRNPNEGLFLEALLTRLGRLGA